MKFLILTSLLFIQPLIGWSIATLSFTGGSGSPVSWTIDENIVFTWDTGGGSTDLFTRIVFQEVYPTGEAVVVLTDVSGPDLTGDNGYSATAGLSLGVDNLGDITNDDFFSSWYTPETGNFSAGDTITIAAGTYSTSQNYSNPLPDIDGTYSVRLTENDGTFLNVSTESVIPEPSHFAILALLPILLMCGRRHCKKAK